MVSQSRPAGTEFWKDSGRAHLTRHIRPKRKEKRAKGPSTQRMNEADGAPATALPPPKMRATDHSPSCATARLLPFHVSAAAIGSLPRFLRGAQGLVMPAADPTEPSAGASKLLGPSKRF